MSTAHIAHSLAQLLQAVSGSSSDPQTTVDTYFASLTKLPAVIKLYLYVLNVFLQNLLVIWRLYVVWGKRWRIIVVPLLLECLHAAIDLRAATLGSISSVNISATTIRGWLIAGWSINLIINVTIVCAIAYRLWKYHKDFSAVLTATSPVYSAVAATIIESGALYTGSEAITFALYFYGGIIGYLGNTVVMQVATLSPLLILVRVGLSLTMRSSQNTSSSYALSRRGRRIDLNWAAHGPGDTSIGLCPQADGGQADVDVPASSDRATKMEIGRRPSSSYGADNNEGSV